MKFEEFVEMFNPYVAAFNKQATEDRIEAFFKVLQQFSTEEVSAALDESAERDDFFPNVSTIASSIKAKYAPKEIRCDYCNGMGWVIVYAERGQGPGQRGPAHTKAEFDADTTGKISMMGDRCSCRGVTQ